MTHPVRREDLRTWWVALAAVPLRSGVGPALLYAAARARVRSWAVYGALWLGICLTGLVSVEDSSTDQFGSFLMVMTWIAGFIQAWLLRRPDLRRVLTSAAGRRPGPRAQES